jgi:type IV pilus assembly protein PilM
MVTLDIEDTSIKMMVVKGRMVETVASLPLEPGLVHDGVIIDPATVGRRISELMAAHGVTEKRVVVGISGIHAIYRTFPLPKLSKQLQDEAAQREIERLMPVPLNELYISWQAINISDMETTVCVIGMPRNTVDAMLETLHQAGLQPEVIEGKPLALARVTDERYAIIINAQPAAFDIVIMIDGIPELLRSLPYPAEAASPDEKVAEVKEELDRTIAYYNSSHKGSELTVNTAAFVSGELGEMLAETLEHRVKPLPQLLSYTDSVNTSEYTANIGLAVRQARADSSSARVSLNVTPEVYLPKQFPIIQLASWAFIVLAIVVLLLFGISTLQKYRGTLTLQMQVNTIRSQVEVRQGTETAIKQLQKQIDQVQKESSSFTQPLDDAKAQRAYVNGGLSQITGLLPGIINLNTISYYTGQSFGVAGTATDDTTIVDYVRSLRNSNQFSSVLISDMREMEYNQWQFTLSLK